jgi:hypothetical protein
MMGSVNFGQAMALVRRNHLDADLEEEMRLHIELRTQPNRIRHHPDEARYAAQRRFGNKKYSGPRVHKGF